MTFVLDGSVAISWAFADGQNAFAESIVQRLRNDDAIVPGIWPLEIANTMVVGQRRGRLPEEDRLRYFRQLQQLPIRIDSTLLTFSAIVQFYDLANAHQLSAYDASYLELAMRFGFPLATLDIRLADAATRAGVPLIADA